jgi:hypothetical protein
MVTIQTYEVHQAIASAAMGSRCRWLGGLWAVLYSQKVPMGEPNPPKFIHSSVHRAENSEHDVTEGDQLKQETEPQPSPGDAGMTRAVPAVSVSH